MPSRTGREYGPPPQIRAKRPGDYLEVMSKAVFQSGMSWDVVYAKWPGIRDAFDEFDAEQVAAYDEQRLATLMQDTRVIRNRRKLEGIVSNAQRILELEREHGTFKKYLESHGGFEETVKSLRKNFSFLGEMGCYYLLYVVRQPVPSHDEWQASRRK